MNVNDLGIDESKLVGGSPENKFSSSHAKNSLSVTGVNFADERESLNSTLQAEKLQEMLGSDDESAGTKTAIGKIKKLMAKKGADGTPVSRDLILSRLGLPQIEFLAAPSMTRWTQLEKLDVSHNNLSAIDAIENLKNLRTIDLGFNYIEQVCNINLPNLQHLTLRNNYIRTFPVFEYCMKLRHLDLKNNSISDLQPLNADFCPNLKTLDL